MTEAHKKQLTYRYVLDNYWYEFMGAGFGDDEHLRKYAFIDLNGYCSCRGYAEEPVPVVYEDCFATDYTGSEYSWAYFNGEPHDYRHRLRVFMCNRCSRWKINLEIIADNRFLDEDENFIFERHGILKTFNPLDDKQPVEALRIAAAKRAEYLYKAPPQKVEEFVGSVLRDYFDCEVILTGRSNDGGVDLLLVDSNAPILVQVKARRSRDFTEPVSVVRELLGSTLLKSGKRCMFVTTGARFSAQARRAAMNAVEKNLVTTFDLVNNNALFSILGLTQATSGEPWEAYIPKKRETDKFDSSVFSRIKASMLAKVWLEYYGSSGKRRSTRKRLTPGVAPDG